MDDPRLTAARPDLAARHLEGKVSAARFVDGVEREVIDAVAPLRHAPAADAALDTEALKGERVTVYEFTDEGWAWGQLMGDGYVGWLPTNALSAPGPAPTHIVTALRTLVFPGPSIKLPPVEALSFGCRVTVVHEDATFAVTAQGGCIPRVHLAPIGWREADWVAAAEQFAHVPYLWGGKTSLGLDCSGLVQTALTAAGISCPRDADMQEKAVGYSVPDLSCKTIRRGDLLFWKGHVAIARDARTMIHANAHHMCVAIEPIEHAVERIRACGGGNITRIRRPINDNGTI